MKKPFWRLATIVGLIAAIAVVGTAGASAHASKAGAVKSGGTLNVGWESSFGFTDNMDPTGEYLGDAFGILDNLLVRTLVGYNHVANAPGNAIVPDIATSVPKPTNGGKTYTFHIKQGVKFGPPLDRQVTSQDFVTSMDRLASKKDGAEYSFYYTPIKGFTAYSDGKAKTISGITTPNASTIVFNLTAPTGDFLYRMTMPATGPMPNEVTKCFENDPGAYADDLISTAGYMIKGIDSVDVSSCAKLVSPKGKPLQPASGYNGRVDPQPRPQPELRAVDGPDAQELRRRGQLHRRLERRRHLQQDRGRSARHGDLEHPERRPQEVRDDVEPEAVLPSELGRPHVVPHDEPDAAAVR